MDDDEAFESPPKKRKLQKKKSKPIMTNGTPASQEERNGKTRKKKNAKVLVDDEEEDEEEHKEEHNNGVDENTKVHVNGAEHANTDSKKAPGQEKKAAAAPSVIVAEPESEPGEHKILAYMIQMNRPFNHLQVFENLHRTVKKAAVPRILDHLTERGKLQRKMFKKVKLYMANQSSYPEVDPALLQQLDCEIVQLSEMEKTEKLDLAALQKAVSSLQSQLSDDDLAASASKLADEVAVMQVKLTNLKGNAGAMSTADLKKKQKRFNTCYTEWKKRKRAAMDMVGQYMENAPKSVKLKRFLEDNGVEPDEEANVSIKDYEKFYQKL